MMFEIGDSEKFEDCVLISREEWGYIQDKTDNVSSITNPNPTVHHNIEGKDYKVYNFFDIVERMRRFNFEKY